MAKEKQLSKGTAEGAGGASKEVRGPGRRLHGAIAHKLGTAILSGQYAPGDVLSGEVAFSEELEVSRSAYREAIQVLTAKGLPIQKRWVDYRVLGNRGRFAGVDRALITADTRGLDRGRWRDMRARGLERSRSLRWSNTARRTLDIMRSVATA